MYLRVGDLQDVLLEMELGDSDFQFACGLKRSDYPRHLYAYLKAVPYFIDCLGFVCYEHHLWGQVYTEVKKEPIPPNIAAGLSVRANIATDLTAAAELVAMGFDVQARNLIRAAREKTDVAWAVAAFPKFAAEFVNCDSVEESKELYFLRMAKGKLRKLAVLAFNELTGSDDNLLEQYWNDFRKDTDDILSIAEHPNHTVGVISLYPNLGRSKSYGIGLRGQPSTISIATLNMIVTIVWELGRITSVLQPIRKELKISKVLDDKSMRAFGPEYVKLLRFVDRSFSLLNEKNG
ncbi:hypothetical protein ACFO5Q_06080 [Kordiimonas lipolytica]|uniref:Uncharacterized protein n=1 Tax=Kordiimonas lipolytica TaxID=1662421 RepID=A0ABV8U872_9PROT|nr:hypothetical protein [Kordiimonas lipolytica]